MRKVGKDIEDLLFRMGADSDTARINMRIHQVRERYKKAIEAVYPPETARLHLAHTNNVIITTKKNVRVLIVYVDDSLYAAELNAQRELIRLSLLEQFNEEVQEFQIKVSRWKKYREMHPYVEEGGLEKKPSSTVALDEEEKAFVKQTVSAIEDEKVRKSLEKAMTADLEWKKGEKV